MFFHFLVRYTASIAPVVSRQSFHREGRPVVPDKVKNATGITHLSGADTFCFIYLDEVTKKVKLVWHDMRYSWLLDTSSSNFIVRHMNIVFEM